MDRRKIARLKRKLERLRAGAANIKREELISFANSLGREKAKRGKEGGAFISTLLPYSRPLSIPKHRIFNPHTVGNILDSLEQDLIALEEMLDDSEAERK